MQHNVKPSKLAYAVTPPQTSKLQIFYKALHNLTALPIPAISAMSLNLHETIITSTISYHHPILTLTNLVFSHLISKNERSHCK